MTSTNDIRRAFLDYFAREGHEIVRSAPLVPQNDPTLMFVNAGMVPFKNVFTGLETRPYVTAASSQKCVRAGGKHNDLDNVGYTARHLTFFEMLGNFSFGDYFKERAIDLAWNAHHQGMGARRRPAHRHRLSHRRRGLGPVEEDRRPARRAHHPHRHQGQFLGDGRQRPVRALLGDLLRSRPRRSPAARRARRTRTATASSRSGTWSSCNMSRRTMRSSATCPSSRSTPAWASSASPTVLQGVHNVFDIDTFRALIDASAELTKTDAGNASHKVIADHLRSSGFLIADGVLPSNEGRGYVLRRIMRRAMRHAHLLGAAEPLMHRLVPALVAEMGAAYPDLVRAQPLIEETLKLEETRFRQTLDNGLRLLDEATADHGRRRHACPAPPPSSSTTRSASPTTSPRTRCAPRASASTAPASTPPWREQKAAARAAWKGSGRRRRTTSGSTSPRSEGATEFTGYLGDEGEGEVVALVKDGARVEHGRGGRQGRPSSPTRRRSTAKAAARSATPERSARTRAWRPMLSDTSKPLGKLHAHHAAIKAAASRSATRSISSVDAARRDKVRANHSATHLLHAALRKRLGTHVTQKGSLVAPDHFRFDFSHPKPLTREEIETVEAEVNRHIRHNRPVGTRLMSTDDAIDVGRDGAVRREIWRGGPRALDGRRGRGELFGRAVRRHPCRALGDIGLFKIISRKRGHLGRAPDRGADRRGGAAVADRPRGPAQGGRRRAQGRARGGRRRASPHCSTSAAGSSASWPRRRRRSRSGRWGRPKAAGPEEIGGMQLLGQVSTASDPKELRGLLDESQGAAARAWRVAVNRAGHRGRRRQ